MAKKLYLSAAAHEHDNPTKCPSKCGENVHSQGACTTQYFFSSLLRLT